MERTVRPPASRWAAPLALALALGGGAGAEPLEPVDRDRAAGKRDRAPISRSNAALSGDRLQGQFGGVAGRGDALFGGELFRRRITRAAERVALELRTERGGSCRRYFSELGVEVLPWLELDGPPYVKEVSGQPRPAALCGRAQAGEPFQWVFLWSECTREADPCRLGSLLLHELGHLARRDAVDNEPAEFFSRCRLSACIDAGRFR